MSQAGAEMVMRSLYFCQVTRGWPNWTPVTYQSAFFPVLCFGGTSYFDIIFALQEKKMEEE